MREVNGRHADDHAVDLASLRAPAERLGTRQDLAREVVRRQQRGSPVQAEHPGSMAVGVDVRSGVVGEQRDFDERLAAIARELLNEPDVEHTLQRVVDAAAANLDGGVWASVTLVKQRREVETPASSDDRATRADHLQYDLEQGPCLDAIWEQETFSIDDMTADERYPRWSRAVAEETGIRSSLSLQLFTDRERGSLGALNLYSPQPHTFDAETRGEGLAFAAQAAVAVRSAQTEAQLRSAMATRTLIGQGQGILMERLKLTPDQAFAVLSRLSQENNVKLREVARRLVETGEIPGRPAN